MQLSDGGESTDYFNGDGNADDLTFQVLGENTGRAVSDLARRLSTSEERARSVLEATTAVFLNSIGAMAGDDLTVESVGACLAAERAQMDNTTPAPGLEATQPVSASTAPAETEPLTEPQPEAMGARSKAWLMAIPAIVVIGAGVGWVATRGGGEDTTLAFTEETSTEAQSTTTAQSTTAAPADGDDSTNSTDETTTSSDSAATDDDTDGAAAGSDQPAVVSPPTPIGAPDNYAVMSQGRIFLRGFLATAEEEALILAAVEQFVGPGVAISEYVIDPERVVEDDGEGTPVYMEDAVLFATGSAEVGPDFAPLLGIGLRLLQVQPGVTLEVTGHTDSAGSDAANLALSQARVDAVKAFFVEQGIAPERIIAVGKGETEPRADNGTEEGRQANRRVEFLVKGFASGA
jgi:outer membrane protein OmpA-like peptidoglycan-associated protein